MNVAFVTTFAKDHIPVYGKRFVSSFTKNCNQNLYIFAEDFAEEDIGHPVLNFYSCIPEQQKFKEKIILETQGLQTKPKNRLAKALRWSYKSYAIWYALSNIEADYIVWLDGDIETIAQISPTLITKNAKQNLIVAYPQLIDGEVHIESGLVIFNKQHPLINKVIDHYYQGYHNYQVLDLNKPWDGFWLAKIFNDAEISNASDLSKDPYKKLFKHFKHHVGKDKFKNTELNKYLGRKSLT